jgi:hypothetical protein
VDLNKGDRQEKPRKSRVVGCGSYGKLRGVRDRAQGVEFRLLNGKGPWPTPENAFLTVIWWEPDTGSILMEYTTGMKITMAGRGLRELADRLRQHRVDWVEEKGNDPVADKADTHPARVYAIAVTMPKEEGERSEPKK